MLPILQRRFRALENSKAAMLEQLLAIPGHRLDERPEPGRWSAAELISHVAKVERRVLETVQQQLAEQETSVKLRDRVGSLIVRNVLRSPLRIRVPAEPVTTLPDEDVDAPTALAEWDRVREQWATFLSHIRASQMRTAVFSHPKSGWFTLPETVLFLRLHHDHHRAQVARLARQLASAPEPVSV